MKEINQKFENASLSIIDGNRELLKPLPQSNIYTVALSKSKRADEKREICT